MHLKRSTKGPSADCRAFLNQALSARPRSMLSCSARLALTRSQWSMGKGAMLRSPASTTDLPACSSASIRCFSTCSAWHQHTGWQYVSGSCMHPHLGGVPE